MSMHPRFVLLVRTRSSVYPETSGALTMSARRQSGRQRGKQAEGPSAGKTGREQGMKESYIKGVANHDDPESCVGDREVVGEALTGARAGWGYRVENREITGQAVPTLWSLAEGNTVSCASAKYGTDSSRSLNSCMHESSLRGNREISGQPIGDGR